MVIENSYPVSTTRDAAIFRHCAVCVRSSFMAMQFSGQVMACVRQLTLKDRCNCFGRRRTSGLRSLLGSKYSSFCWRHGISNLQKGHRPVYLTWWLHQCACFNRSTIFHQSNTWHNFFYFSRIEINSLGANDAIWWHTSGWNLTEIMAYYPTKPTHFTN